MVIQFNKIGKSYMIGHKGQDQRYNTLRDIISRNLSKWRTRILHPNYYTHENLEEFWALKDVDIEVNEGDRLGIIGRNGAGKTTLLKVLSRITEPTTGQIKVKGRVASLLEVGTGFHPELSGRENIFLNGSILGMTRSEIKEKFDEIVDFAGVENFLDTPVKRYSSGMHVRLGFSVAAHLEPEILVVDEVLAVGDAAFQKKCISKMSSVSKEGRTIIFVSHNMKAVEMLCDRAILLENGCKILEGEPTSIIEHYLNESDVSGSSKKIGKSSFEYPEDLSKSAQIHRVRIFNSKEELSFKHNIIEPIRIKIDYELRIDYPTVFLQCEFHPMGQHSQGNFLSQMYDMENFEHQKNNKNLTSIFPFPKGKYTASLFLQAPLLSAGLHRIELYITTGPFRQDTCSDIYFEITDSGSFASVVRNTSRGGLISIPLKWEVNKLD